MSTLSIATSGLSAASLRLNVAANNIANAFTTGPLPAADGSAPAAASAGGSTNSTFPPAYTPLQVNQTDQANGGTVATVSPVSPGSVPQYDPTAPFANQNGLVAAPNVDLASQFVQLLVAKYSFAANAQVIKAYASTTKSLLDIST